MTDRPIGDAVDRLGSGGEGFSAIVEAGKDQAPTATAEGWFEWGKRNQFGAGVAVRVARNAWATVGKFTWKPGGRP